VNAHTPGPWKNTPWKVNDYHAHCVIDEWGHYVCTCQGELMKENAALIAQAPDLLKERDALKADNAKLRAALEAMLKLSFTHPVDPQYRVSVHEQARIALNSTQPAP